MNTLCFTLTMPNRGSWNGRWSGENDYYAVTRVLPRKGAGRDAALQLVGRSFHYSWSDGWGANVSVRLIDGREASVVRKRSKGFCGYEWMVDSLLKRGRILADHELSDPTPKEGLTQ